MTIEAECCNNNKNGKETYSLLQFLAVDTTHTKRMLAEKKMNVPQQFTFPFLFILLPTIRVTLIVQLHEQ